MTNETEENVIKTDLLDKDLGKISKQEAHKGKGILHKAIIVVVRDSGGEYLLTKRSTFKQLWPDFYDISINTHPKPDESYETAVIRRLKEELDLNVHNLRSIGVFSYFAEYEDKGSENEFCRIFLVENIDRREITPNPKEISNYIFVGEGQIREFICEGTLAPWAKLIVNCGYLNLDQTPMV